MPLKLNFCGIILPPKLRTSPLLSKSKHTKTVMWLSEKIKVLDKCLHLSLSEFGVNESTICYICKKEESVCKSVSKPAPESAKVTSQVQDEGILKNGIVAKSVGK